MNNWISGCPETLEDRACPHLLNRWQELINRGPSETCGCSLPASTHHQPWRPPRPAVVLRHWNWNLPVLAWVP